MEGIDDALMAQLAVDGYSEDMGSMMGSMDEADMMEAMKAMQSGGMPPGMGGGGSSALAGPPSEVSLPAGGPDGMGRVTMEEIKKWVEIYPCYLCENLDPRHGRRLPKSKLAGLTDVRWNEIASSAVNLGFRAVAEPNKRHPRDPFNPGRVRVELYHPGTHEPIKSDIPSKQKLLERIAAALPDDPARKHNQAAYAAAVAEMKRREEAFLATREGKAALQAEAAAKAKAASAGGGGGRASVAALKDKEAEAPSSGKKKKKR